MNQLRKYAVVLSVYLNTRGFAFVLFEGPLSPFDWGVKEVRVRGKHDRGPANIKAILGRYHPDILVLQDTSSSGTVRAPRINHLNTAVAKLGEGLGIPVYAYSREIVLSAFACLGAANKQSVAEVIAKHVPAFERYVPPPRKPWMSEHARMGLFDAAALGLVFFQRVGGAQSPLPPSL
jgi:hypothetical protein